MPSTKLIVQSRPTKSRAIPEPALSSPALTAASLLVGISLRTHLRRGSCYGRVVVRSGWLRYRIRLVCTFILLDLWRVEVLIFLLQIALSVKLPTLSPPEGSAIRRRLEGERNLGATICCHVQHHHLMWCFRFRRYTPAYPTSTCHLVLPSLKIQVIYLLAYEHIGL